MQNFCRSRIGGPGTGKTHIATAHGVQAVEHHRKKVRFFAPVDLANALEQETGFGEERIIACIFVIF